MNNIILYLILIISKIYFGQYTINQPIPVEQSWTNIGIPPPLIYIYFSSDFKPINTINNFWIKLYIPFYTLNINAEWAEVNNCTFLKNNMITTVSERYSGDTNYSYFYIQLKDSVYKSGQTYVIRINPDLYIDYIGYTEPLQIYIISGNIDNHIVYAYNNAFVNLYSSPAPKYIIIISDLTTDINKTKRDTNINSNIIVQVPATEARRIIIETSADYSFGQDSEIKCQIIENIELGIKAIPKEDYKCYFSDAIGKDKNKFIVFEWLNYYIKEAKYQFYYTIQSPIFQGSHSVNVYLMDGYGNLVYAKQSLNNIFKTNPSLWADSYPKLLYSFNVDANDPMQPFGLFSMTVSENQVYNSIIIKFKAGELVPRLAKGDSYSLEIQLGASDLVIPLGYIHDNLDLAAGFTYKKISYNKDRIIIDNILIFNGKEYIVSFKMGIKEPINLLTNEESGFGYVNLLYKGNTFFKSKAKMKDGFNKVYDNKNIKNPEADFGVDNKYRHRAVSSFSSGFSSYFNNIGTNYYITPKRNGLRFGDNQHFFFQSSFGSNKNYITSTVNYNDISSDKSFIEVITDKSISSKATNYYDSFADSNCMIYLSNYNKFHYTINNVDIQTLYAPDFGAGFTVNSYTDNKFIKGCSYKLIENNGLQFSRFRMRFEDKIFKYGAPENDNKLSALKLITMSDSDLLTTAGKLGNIYIWKDIDITSRPTEINMGDNDSTILDVYLNIYYYSNAKSTDDVLNIQPTLRFMENLYILDELSDAHFKMSDFKISYNNIYLYDNDATANINYIGNTDTLIPYVMHLYGSISKNFKPETYSLKIFFDFVEPITYDDDNNISCSGEGITITSCKLVSGIYFLRTNTYKNADTTTQKLYSINPRYNNAVIINFSLKDFTTSTKFSIAFPFKTYISSVMNELIQKTYMNNVMNSIPSFVIFDNNYRELHYSDLGSTGEDYSLWLIHTNLVNPSNTAVISSLKKSNSDVAKLDDATVDDNPTNSVWVSSTSSNPGSYSNVKLKINCDNCNKIIVDNQLIYGTVTFCQDYNFYNHKDFKILNIPVDTRAACHRIRYKTINNEIRYCIFCPNVSTSTPVNQDSSALEFTIENFLLPNVNGLTWPASTYGILSQNYIKSYNSIEVLNSIFTPNVLLIKSTKIAIPQNKHSVTIDLNFSITNELISGYVIFLRVSSGTSIISILGYDQSPPCFIYKDLIEYSCQYKVINQGIYVIVKNIIKPGELFIKLYGLSSGTSVSSSSVKFSVETRVDIIDINDTKKVIDKSGNTEFLEIIFTSPESIGSGKITIKNLYYASNIYNSYTDILIKVQLTGRNILLTDEIIINFGAGSYDTTDDPVWCLILDSYNYDIIESPKTCNTNVLSQLHIKFMANLALKEFIVAVYNFKLPSQLTPGVIISYAYNNGFIAFSSEVYEYNNLVTLPSFKVSFKATGKLEGRGFKNIYNFKITPDTTIGTSDMIYLKFSANFLSNLSKSPIYAYNVKTGKPLMIWIDDYRTIVVTGWEISLDGGIEYEFELKGIEAPGGFTQRYIQALVYKESDNPNIITDSLNISPQQINYSQWGVSVLDPQLKSSLITYLYLKKITYTNKIVRSNSGFELEFSYSSELSNFQYIEIFFDVLEQEMVKNYLGGCKIYLKSDSNKQNITTNCKFIGNNIQTTLVKPITANTVIVLKIDDYPNSDYAYCGYQPPQVFISNAVESKILVASNNLVNNIDRSKFGNYPDSLILNFNIGNSIGELQIPRGFYYYFDIVIDQKNGEAQYFRDKLYINLSKNLDGLISYSTVKYLGVNDFLTEIGNSRKRITIGVSKTAVLTNYYLLFSKSELYTTSLYIDLPLLKIKAINRKSSFINSNTIVVYRGSISLPIYIETQYIPIEDQYFILSFEKQNGNIETELSIRNEITEIKITKDKPIEVIKIMADIKTIKSESKLYVTPQTTNNLIYNSFTFNVIIKDKTVGLTEKVLINYREQSYYNITIDFTSNTSTYIIYYFAPDYEYTDLGITIIENWIKYGINSIGNMQMGYALINDFIKPETKFYTNLLSNTFYKLKLFYSTPETSANKVMYSSFTTMSKVLRNGYLKFYFNQPVFIGYKQRLLCYLSSYYSIPSENLWTDDGINCENSLLKDYIYNDINAMEYTINITIAEINANSTNAKLDSEPVDLNKIYGHTLYMGVYVFESMKPDQKQGIFNTLFTDTRYKTSVSKYNTILKNPTLIKNITSFYQIFLTSKPYINKNIIEYTYTNNTLHVKNIISNSTGFLLGVIAFNDTYKTIDIPQLKQVNSFINYKLVKTIRYKKNEILFEKLDSNKTYSAFIIGINDDPRESALASNIINITFTTNSNKETSYSPIIIYVIGLIYSIIN